MRCRNKQAGSFEKPLFKHGLILDQNNTTNNRLSQDHPDLGGAQNNESRDEDILRGPKSVVIDLGPAIRDFENDVKYMRQRIDVEDVLKYLTKEIISKDEDKDAVYNFIADVRFKNEERMAPNEMECLAAAIEKFGLTLIDRLRQHNIYNPETGRFEYGFYGFGHGNGSMAVFRTLMLQ